jgi:hypothetical protein
LPGPGTTCQRHANIAAAPAGIVDGDAPCFLTGAAVARDDVVVDDAEEDHAGADGESAILNEGSFAARHTAACAGGAVLPERAAGGSIKREDAGAWRDDIPDAVDDEARRLQILSVVAGVDRA